MRQHTNPLRILVVGWFSHIQGHATGGDLLAAEVVCGWLDQAGLDYDIAVAPPFIGGTSLDSADPAAFSHLVFVCGPFTPTHHERVLLERFASCRLIGVNVSLADNWNPFDFLIERDRPGHANPDLVFAADRALVPSVGLCLVDDYSGADTHAASAALRRIVATREVAIHAIDTRLDVNTTGFRTPSEIESAIAKLDVMLTTRLHGMVMALKHGVPVVAIDAEPQGGKILRQAQTLGWPMVFSVDRIDEDRLQEAFDYCLTPVARALARNLTLKARDRIEALGAEFRRAVRQNAALDARFRSRRARVGLPTPPNGQTLRSGLRRVLSPITRIARGMGKSTKAAIDAHRVGVVTPVTIRKTRCSDPRGLS